MEYVVLLVVVDLELNATITRDSPPILSFSLSTVLACLLAGTITPLTKGKNQHHEEPYCEFDSISLSSDGIIKSKYYTFNV